MKKMKVVLTVSLVLNAVLIAALVAGRTYVRKKGFEAAALHAEAEANLSTLYLGILESEREDRITHLSERLKESIKNAESAQATMKQAATW